MTRTLLNMNQNSRRSYSCSQKVNLFHVLTEEGNINLIWWKPGKQHSIGIAFELLLQTEFLCLRLPLVLSVCPNISGDSWKDKKKRKSASWLHASCASILQLVLMEYFLPVSLEQICCQVLLFYSGSLFVSCLFMQSWSSPVSFTVLHLLR